MNKKIIIFRILIIIIVLAIVGIFSILILNKNSSDNRVINGINSIIKKDEVKSNEPNDNIFYNYDKKKDKIILHLTYNKSELYDVNGNKGDYKNSFDYLILSFHENDVDVCFDECVKVNYILNDNKIVINEGTDFSGKYELDDKEETAILKKNNDDGSTLYYYFDKPKG